MGNPYVHLTNYTVNKSNEAFSAKGNYCFSSIRCVLSLPSICLLLFIHWLVVFSILFWWWLHILEEDGHKRTFTWLLQYLEQQEGNQTKETTLDKICDLIVKTIIGKPNLRSILHEYHWFRGTTDIYIDIIYINLYSPCSSNSTNVGRIEYSSVSQWLPQSLLWITWLWCIIG